MLTEKDYQILKQRKTTPEKINYLAYRFWIPKNEALVLYFSLKRGLTR